MKNVNVECSFCGGNMNFTSKEKLLDYVVNEHNVGVTLSSGRKRRKITERKNSSGITSAKVKEVLAQILS